jgi:hypothetical protein
MVLKNHTSFILNHEEEFNMVTAIISLVVVFLACATFICCAISKPTKYDRMVDDQLQEEFIRNL